MAAARFKIHPVVTVILALTVVFSLAQRFRGPTRAETTSFSTPMREPQQTEPVPGKPGWLRSEVFAEETEEDQLNATRNRFAERFNPKEYQVFWADDPLDEAKPPEGWLEDQKRKFGGTPPPPGVVIEYAYRPYRIFVVPRAEGADAIRRFRVGTHHRDDPKMIESVVKRVEAIHALVPSDILHMGSSHLKLAFREKAGEAASKALQELFPLEEEGDMEPGMEGYTSEWMPEDGPDFLAKAFQRDQGIHLWWD